MTPAAFAIPGDIDQKTGGYIYEKSLLLALRAAGRPVAHVELPASFPDPTPADTARAIAQLAALPPDQPVILDGLVYGSIDTRGLASLKAPLVAMIHHPLGMETGLSPARATELLHREAANLTLAAHVVVPSPHTARILAANFGVPPARITIAPPGFAAPDPLRTPVTPPLILSVGLIAVRKGHDVLIRALSRIADLEWQAQIVGGTHDPVYAAALKSRIEAATLTPRITMRGRMATEDLATLYQQATLFALATRYEGYGMVFGEALLHGLPIVTCSAGAVPETVPPGAGTLVTVDDDRAFAAALRHLLTDPAARTAMASTSTTAGHALPRWSATAAIMGGVLDRL